jgi:hypothetical protein
MSGPMGAGVELVNVAALEIPVKFVVVIFAKE